MGTKGTALLCVSQCTIPRSYWVSPGIPAKAVQLGALSRANRDFPTHIRPIELEASEVPSAADSFLEVVGPKLSGLSLRQ